MKYSAAFFFLMAFMMVGNIYAAAREPQFFSLAQDVPLMSGLVEIDGEAISFDKPEGRIIESVARMNGVSEESALAFYHAALPQFGWSKVGSNKFMRKAEFLEIYFQEINGNNLIKIMIKPAL